MTVVTLATVVTVVTAVTEVTAVATVAYLWKAANGLPINTFETKRPPARVIVQAPNFRQKGKIYHVNLNKVFLLRTLH